MPSLSESNYLGDLLKYEAPNLFSRESITVAAGANLSLGTVLGRITASGKYTLSPATGADGSQTAVAVLLYPVNATLADAVGIVVTRGPAIVSRAALAYEATVNDAAKIAAKITQLAAVGIFARDGV